MELHFLHGSETGTGEILCEDLAAAMHGKAACTISSLEATKPADLDAESLHIFAISTTGMGDVPFGAYDFFEALEKDAPDLSHLRFAMFGLGDTFFAATFNQASEKMMQALIARKAQMIGERGLFDASSGDMPEDIALPWLEEVLARLESRA